MLKLLRLVALQSDSCEHELMQHLDPDKGPLYSEDGVDLTLIRWMLSLTIDERLDVLQQNVNSIVELQNAAGR